MNYLLLMMGGRGTRLGSDVPKQYILVENRPVFSYILEAHQNCSHIDKIFIVSNSDWIDCVNDWVKKLGANKVVAVIHGGPNRSVSVLNGLRVMKDFAVGEDIVLIHDATHPYCDEDGIAQVIEAVKEYGGATLGQSQYDTVYQTNAEGCIETTLQRQRVFSGASPEAFYIVQ